MITPCLWLSYIAAAYSAAGSERAEAHQQYQDDATAAAEAEEDWIRLKVRYHTGNVTIIGPP